MLGEPSYSRVERFRAGSQSSPRQGGVYAVLSLRSGIRSPAPSDFGIQPENVAPSVYAAPNGRIEHLTMTESCR
jgi:hypothetical protein